MMNERIKKLAEQVSGDVIRCTPSFLVTREMVVQKFAESIVRECAALVSDYSLHRIPASEYSNLLKEHFGVVEK